MFPGAAADRSEADYAIVGAPLDASTSFQPGTRFGPDRVRRFGSHFEDYDHHTGRRFSTLSVHDHGNVGAGSDTAEYLDFLSGVLADYDAERAVPLLIGGEHTVSIAGLRAVTPDTFVCLDAHLDLRERYAGDPRSHATVTHHALDCVDEAIIIGARAGCEQEWERANRDDVTVVPPEDAPSWEPELDGDVYLSVDIDAADPGYAPGTGTPEPFGLDPATIHDVVRTVAPAAVGFDVVEVNDRDDGQAATLGAKLLRAFVYAHAQT